MICCLQPPSAPGPLYFWWSLVSCSAKHISFGLCNYILLFNYYCAGGFICSRNWSSRFWRSHCKKSKQSRKTFWWTGKTDRRGWIYYADASSTFERWSNRRSTEGFRLFSQRRLWWDQKDNVDETKESCRGIPHSPEWSRATRDDRVSICQLWIQFLCLFSETMLFECYFILCLCCSELQIETSLNVSVRRNSYKFLKIRAGTKFSMYITRKIVWRTTVSWCFSFTGWLFYKTKQSLLDECWCCKW